jgi:hypothetical protein
MRTEDSESYSVQASTSWQAATNQSPSTEADARPRMSKRARPTESLDQGATRLRQQSSSDLHWVEHDRFSTIIFLIVGVIAAIIKS